MDVIGVLKTGCTRATTPGNLPRSAIANVIREPANIEPSIWPAADIRTPTDTNVAPTGPATILATPATGRSNVSPGATTTTTNWTNTYTMATSPVATRSARGPARSGSITSEAGIIAASKPPKANTHRSVARAQTERSRDGCRSRGDDTTKSAAPHKTTSGISLTPANMFSVTAA